MNPVNDTTAPEIAKDGEPKSAHRKHWLSTVMCLGWAVVCGIAQQYTLSIAWLALAIFIVATDND